jgi:lysozyme family protein
MKWLTAFLNMLKKKPSPKPDLSTPDIVCENYACTKPSVDEYVPPKYRGQYKALWDSMTRSYLKGQNESTLVWTINYILKHKQFYEDSEKVIGVPWKIIAAAHMREASGDFSKQILNGQPWNRKTTWVPKGYGPWSSWIESTKTAFEIKDLPSKWTIDNTLYFAERFNGMGYRLASKASIVGFSPYVWAFTQHYKGGYYVSDGKFSASAVAKGVGFAVILKELGFQGE